MALMDFGDFDIDPVTKPDYKLLCCVDARQAEYPVTAPVDEIIPESGLYVHVDLVIPDLEEQGDLLVAVTTLLGTGIVKGWFDKVNIPLYRDGDHLHLKPTLLTDLFGPEYVLDEDEQDFLVMTLYKDDEEELSCRIPRR